jgi:hypothetical protein
MRLELEKLCHLRGFPCLLRSFLTKLSGLSSLFLFLLPGFCLLSSVEAAVRGLPIHQRKELSQLKDFSKKTEPARKNAIEPARRTFPEKPLIINRRLGEKEFSSSTWPEAGKDASTTSDDSWKLAKEKAMPKPETPKNWDKSSLRFESSLNQRPLKGAPVVWLEPQKERIANALETLSMQDINRFQFRRNHSSEPGLPIQKAGGP